MNADLDISVNSEIEFIFNNRDTVGNLEKMLNTSNLSFPSFSNYVPTTENEKVVGEIDLTISQEIMRCMSPVIPISSKSKLSLRKENIRKLRLAREPAQILSQSVDEEFESVTPKLNGRPYSQTEKLCGKLFDLCGVSPVSTNASLGPSKSSQTVTVNAATAVNVISDVLITPANKPANKPAEKPVITPANKSVEKPTNKSQRILRDLLAKPHNKPLPKRSSQIAKRTTKRSSQTHNASLSIARIGNGALIGPVPSTSTATASMLEPIPSTSTADPSKTFRQLSVQPSSAISRIDGDGLTRPNIFCTAIQSAVDEKAEEIVLECDSDVDKFLREKIAKMQASLKEYIGVQRYTHNTHNPGDSSQSVALKQMITKLEGMLALLKS